MRQPRIDGEHCDDRCSYMEPRGPHEWEQGEKGPSVTCSRYPTRRGPVRLKFHRVSDGEGMTLGLVRRCDACLDEISPWDDVPWTWPLPMSVASSRGVVTPASRLLQDESADFDVHLHAKPLSERDARESGDDWDLYVRVTVDYERHHLGRMQDLMDWRPVPVTHRGALMCVLNDMTEHEAWMQCIDLRVVGDIDSDDPMVKRLRAWESKQKRRGK